MLLDSNIIIYSAEPQNQQIRDLIALEAPSVSEISYLEVLGFPRITPLQIQLFNEFFASAPMLAIDRPILDRAVSVRQQRRMSLGDAIVAATALVHDKTLVTRNTADFRWIAGLRLLDPFAAPPSP
jgi:predicted nucleic acid-binding protein